MLIVVKALAWTFIAVDVLLVAGRLLIRLKKNKKIYTDDVALTAALFSLIGYFAGYANYFPLYYQVEYFSAGLPVPEPTAAQLKVYFKAELGLSFMLWVVMFFVKLSFLLFYKSLFWPSDKFRIAWWVVLVFTVIVSLASALAVFLGVW